MRAMQKNLDTILIWDSNKPIRIDAYEDESITLQ